MASLRARRLVRAAVLAAGLTAPALHAQELEPRAFAPAPVGTSVLLGGFGRSAGGILLDASLDVDHVEADLWIATFGGGHTFDLLGRQARLLAVVPFAWGDVVGEVGAQPQRQGLTGLADPRIKLSVGLRGAPALTREAFARAPRRTALGASVTVMVPLGQYESSRLVNLGYHRWAVKPEVGVSMPMTRWTVDASVGVWLFSTNAAYFPGGARRQQEPVVALQGHASRGLPRRTWIAVNGTWFAGGDTRVDGVLNRDRQRNTRLGVTYSVPVSARQSLKFVYSTGASTRRGSDFDTVNVTWQWVVF